MTSTSTVALLTPEIVLAGTATLIYVLGAFIKARETWSWLAVIGLFVAGLALLNQTPTSTFDGPLAADSLSVYVRWLMLVVGVLMTMLTAKSAAASQTSEYVGSLLMAVTGAMIVAVSGDLILLFLGLEMISIPTYVLLYLGRGDQASQEATVKYFFLSILSSALLLYGFSFLYGISGSTQLADVYRSLVSANADSQAWQPLGGLALVLIFAGLSFKIAAAPFHFYAPDVYQGATPGNAALLAVVPKIAGIVALVRLVTLAMPSLEGYGWRVALILSILTMTIGNVLALWQDNIRRLLAYSSVAHAGYMLIGIAVSAAAATELGGDLAVANAGAAAAIFYLVVYAVATIGSFAVLAWLADDEKQIDSIDQLAGLSRSHPLAAAAMGVFMFSLMGIPPLAGFWGKLQLFFSAIAVEPVAGAGASLQNWFITLAVIGALNAAIAAAYYLRIVGAMFFRAPLAAPQADGGAGAWSAMMASALLVLGIGLAPGTVMRGAEDAIAAARTLHQPQPVETAKIKEVPAEKMVQK